MTPKRKEKTPFAIVNLIPSRRVRRRNRSANGCPPYDCLICLNTRKDVGNSLKTLLTGYSERK
ncbi:MAG: hypothetical protein LBK82_10125 [Planctomycetaceae bacterium]|nr:hypothetical protein [Planctomycetaceae bacterium]